MIAFDYFNFKLWKKLEVNKNNRLRKCKNNDFVISQFVQIFGKIKFEIELRKKDQKIK